MFEGLKSKFVWFAKISSAKFGSMLFAILACLGSLNTKGLHAASFQIVEAVYAGKGFQANMPNIKAIVLEGVIEAGDAKKLSDLLLGAADKEIDVRQTYLRSPGGVLVEGFEIGRIIRQSGIIAIAPDLWPVGDVPYCVMPFLEGRTQYPDDPKCICGSACAIAWFGGIARWGNVGLHRSYVSRSSPDIGFRMTEDLLRESYGQISDYLDEMRIPIDVVEKILSTSSSQISYLSEEEQAKLNLDRVFEEYLISSCGDYPFMPWDEYLLFSLAAKEGDANVQLDKNERAALKFMRYADSAYARCFEETHRSIIELAN